SHYVRSSSIHLVWTWLSLGRWLGRTLEPCRCLPTDTCSPVIFGVLLPCSKLADNALQRYLCDRILRLRSQAAKRRRISSTNLTPNTPGAKKFILSICSPGGHLTCIQNGH